METAVTGYLTTIGDAFLDPQKRVFVGYLGSALMIAAAVSLLAARGNVRFGFADLWRRVLSPSVWWSPSARADYKLFAVNQALMLGLAPRLLSQIAVATLLFEQMHRLFGAPPAFGHALPAWSVVAAFTLTQFLVDDASRYLVHRLLHRSRILWAFHKVHHSAETLTPMTVFRTHPVEGVLFALRSVVVHGAVIGVFVFFFGDKVDLATVLGANVFLFLFNAAGANLRHSHVSISYGAAVERILMSPAQHQIHHSTAPEHFDRNFGSVLALWDLIGGTLHRAERGREIHFGLSGDPAMAGHDLRRLYLVPFREAGRLFCRAVHTITTGVFTVTTPTVPAAVRGPARRLCRARRAATSAALLAAFAMTPLGDAPAANDAKSLDIYSHRQPFLIEPFIKAYQKKTGVKVNIVYASRGLAQRLIAEGARSPADLVLTVDIGRLAVYADQDLLAPVDSDILRRNIPAHLRDPGNRWFSLSKRARVVAVSKDRVEEGAIRRIEDLADSRWKGRICSRPGSHVYNRALMASLIAADGNEAAAAWAQGLVGNLARRPQGNDRAQLKAIYQGECDIAIINHYYWGKLRYGDIPDQRRWADAVRVVFTNQQDRGNHVNISGGGVAKHADNKEGAVRFLEFLSQPEAQGLYGSVNFEYPVNPEVKPSKELQALGDFKEDALPITRIAELAPAAQRIIDQVGW